MKSKDIHVALKRKKLWDYFGWTYKGFGYLSKNHSLNCGCALCKGQTEYYRRKNKKERLKAKRELKKFN